MTADGTPSKLIPFDPFNTRERLRLTTIYATSRSLDASMLNEATQPFGDVLRMGRLAQSCTEAQDQLPRVLHCQSLDADSVSFQRWSGNVQSACFWLFTVTSGQVLAALSLDVTAGLLGVIPLLEDLYYADVKVGREPLEGWSGSLASTLGVKGRQWKFLERHQLVFAGLPDGTALPDGDVVQRVIYRSDLPVRDDNSSIIYPVELNRRPTTLGALGPYVSVIVGHQDYLENAILLSAAQVIGCASRLRQIRQLAYESVATFRAHSKPGLPITQRRLVLEQMSYSFRDLELDLSFQVEAIADLAVLIPALRLDAYHQNLYAAMNLSDRATTAGQMLRRLRNAIEAELTSVQSAERRIDDARRTRTVIAVTFVTTVAGTLSLFFGFLGANATQVQDARSMFDSHYRPIYASILLIFVLAMVIYWILQWQERRKAALDELGTKRKIWDSAWP